MSLPGHANALISALLAANRNTAIVLQSGCPLEMPWSAAAPAILQSWYGGNETGNAIADVLFGAVNPAGKLPLSFPARVQDNPAFLNFRSDRGRVLYGEDVFVGYRFYEKVGREVRFPFGHGLSYTRFEMSDVEVEVEEDQRGDTVRVSVQVRNTGDVAGAEVVQVYVSQKAPGVTRPVKELKGFDKVFLEPGQRKEAVVRLRKKYAASWWDELRAAWVMEEGAYEVHVGNSSASTPLKGEFEVAATSYWRGL